MLIYYFTEVHRSFDEAGPALTHLLSDPAGSTRAYREGRELQVELGLIVASEQPTGELMSGEAIRLADQITIPIHWTKGSLFPFSSMEADLRVARLGDETSQLALSGAYSLPPDRVGLPAGRLHRVAEATIKLFVDRLASALSAKNATDGIEAIH